MPPATPAPFVLERTADRGRHNDALATATGGRVGLDGVLAELSGTGRQARRTRVLGTRTATALAWELRDDLSRRWWPQGVTTSADAGALTPGGEELYAGRSVVLTSAYSKVVDGAGHGARISVVDLTDLARVRYEHVLLVKAAVDGDGQVTLEPVHAHAGGLVWHGDHLHVAATRRGFHTFRLRDLVAVGGLDHPEVIGRLPGGGLGAHGHRWVLPTWCGHAARTDAGASPFRYTWLSSSREGDRVSLLTGEYTHPSQRGSTRLAELTIDTATGLPALDAEGRARPTLLGEGVPQAQGSVRVGGRLYVGTSNGRFRRGSVWVADGTDLEPGSFTRLPASLPVGPEDLAYWPSRDQVWTVTEYPGRRRLVALDRSRLEPR